MNSKNKVDLKLDWCSHAAAKYACEHWHYSKTIPTGKCNYIGAWEDGCYIGCIIFGLGASASLCKPYKLDVFQVCELVRVAMSKHASQISRIVSIAIKMIKRKNKGIRLLISFADPFNGHIGGDISSW